MQNFCEVFTRSNKNPRSEADEIGENLICAQFAVDIASSISKIVISFILSFILYSNN